MATVWTVQDEFERIVINPNSNEQQVLRAFAELIAAHYSEEEVILWAYELLKINHPQFAKEVVKIALKRDIAASDHKQTVN